MKMDNSFVYIGTYTKGRAEGIYIFRLDGATGAMTRVGAVGGLENPSYLALHPSGKFLYAVGEVGTFRGATGGAIAAFARDKKTGALTFLNVQSTRGADPCHLAVDPTGKVVVAANYSGGSVTSFPLGPDGKLAPAASFIQHTGKGPDASRQEAPHAHGATFDASGKMVWVCDLGTDKVMAYRVDTARGTLAPANPPFISTAPGAGPRHCIFDAHGRHLYVINEMASTIEVFTPSPAAPGTLHPVQTVSTLPANFGGKSTTAEIMMHPGGKALYGSNRGHDSIAAFAVRPDGTLKLTGFTSTQGKTPRGFGVDPSGRYLVAGNQDSEGVFVFRTNPATGDLSPTAQGISVPSPVCVVFHAE